MLLRCIGRYRSSLGEWNPGDLVQGTDAFLGEVLRSSPGSFEIVDETPEPDADAEITAMSTETATGLVKPDRRQRGGRVR